MAFSSNNKPDETGRHFSGAHAKGNVRASRKRSAGSARAGAHSTEGTGTATQVGAHVTPRVSSPADTATVPGIDPMDEAAPQPIDPEATNSFGTIASDEGAIMGEDAVQTETDEDNEDDQKPGRSFMLILAIVVAAVIAGGFYLFASSCTSKEEPQQQETQQSSEQTQTSSDDTIEYRGTTYSLTQNDQGKYTLTQTDQADGSQPVELGQIDGTPAKLVLYNGAIIIPESKSDGTWDVMAYTIGSGWGQLADQQGNAYSGQGSISDAQLDGSNLVLTVDGSQTTVPLEW